LNTSDFDARHRMAVQKLHAKKIDFTGFLVWFIEHFPNSVKETKTNTECFKRFMAK
jgi:hypothetical protein